MPASKDGSLLFTSRTDHGRLDLQRRAGFSHESADGVYECQIPDEKGRTQTLYTWIYSGPLCKFHCLPHLLLAHLSQYTQLLFYYHTVKIFLSFSAIVFNSAK